MTRFPSDHVAMPLWSPDNGLLHLLEVWNPLSNKCYTEAQYVKQIKSSATFGGGVLRAHLRKAHPYDA